jgi:hypothetical protein
MRSSQNDCSQGLCQLQIIYFIYNWKHATTAIYIYICYKRSFPSTELKFIWCGMHDWDSTDVNFTFSTTKLQPKFGRKLSGISAHVSHQPNKQEPKRSSLNFDTSLAFSFSVACSSVTCSVSVACSVSLTHHVLCPLFGLSHLFNLCCLVPHHLGQTFCHPCSLRL